MTQNITKLKAWINAIRPRTIPLSISGVLLGSFIALKDNNFSAITLLWCLLTIVLLQILSNLANDLGDTLKGTDNNKRTGPMRSVQSGIISTREMKLAIIFCSILALTTGVILLFQSLPHIDYSFFTLLTIGILGIASAIKYTLGKGAYGYYGLGDLFVMIFFGFIPVGIAYFVQTKSWDNSILLAGLSVGCFSTSVLNLNNLRDYKNDKICNKNTMIVKMGISYGKLYHTILIFTGIASSLIYTTTHFYCIYNYIYTIIFIPFIMNVITVIRTPDTVLLDGELKRNAISTFLLTILWGTELLC